MVEIHIEILGLGKYQVEIKRSENNPSKKVHYKAETPDKKPEKKSAAELIAEARRACEACINDLNQRRGGKFQDESLAKNAKNR